MQVHVVRTHEREAHPLGGRVRRLVVAKDGGELLAEDHLDDVEEGDYGGEREREKDNRKSKHERVK